MRPFPHPSQEDLLLDWSSASSQTCHLPTDVAELEEVARRGLEPASVVDEFVGGCQGPGPLFRGIPVARFVAQGLWFHSSSQAKLHTNCVLARRDAALLSSPIAVSQVDRASLWAVPIANCSLFAQHVRPFLQWEHPCLLAKVAGHPSTLPWQQLVRLLWWLTIWWPQVWPFSSFSEGQSGFETQRSQALPFQEA